MSGRAWSVSPANSSSNRSSSISNSSSSSRLSIMSFSIRRRSGLAAFPFAVMEGTFARQMRAKDNRVLCRTSVTPLRQGLASRNHRRGRRLYRGEETACYEGGVSMWDVILVLLGIALIAALLGFGGVAAAAAGGAQI